MALYTILEFRVCQGDIYYHSEKEYFLTYSEAKAYMDKNYSSKGHFWSGLTEYKIVKLNNKIIEYTSTCYSVHERFLKKKYHFA